MPGRLVPRRSPTLTHARSDTPSPRTQVEEREDGSFSVEEIEALQDDLLHRMASLRTLQQTGPFPAGARVVDVNSEEELSLAFKNKERFINLRSHIILSGQYAGPGESLLPSVKASVTIFASCPEPYDGKCMINAQGQGQIFFFDNSGFQAGMEVKMDNMILINGAAPKSGGGAIANTGAMSFTLTNVDFVSNSGGSGGACSFVEGAFPVLTDCTFKKNFAATDGSGSGTGGAVLMTGAGAFTRVAWTDNGAMNGGAIGVGGSAESMFFDQCVFSGNSAEIFGNDVYFESWAATVSYWNPYPPEKVDIYTSPANIQPLSMMPPLFYPDAAVSPPPAAPNPPSPPPPAPPSPPNASNWIYTEDQLWFALDRGDTTIPIGSHPQSQKDTGRWATSPPPPIISEVRVYSQCEGYGRTCIIDMAGARFPLFDIRTGSIFEAYNLRIINAATMGDGGAVQISAPQRAIFDTVDMNSNFAENGGAVFIKGSMNVVFKKCSFSLNWADSKGGAVYMVGSTVEFDDTSFYLNQASSGGAIAMGPGSTAFILTSNFTSNKAKKWGPDVFLTTPVGSKVYLNQWPPEAVAKFFPPQTNIEWFYAPPPAAPYPPSPPPGFKRASYPPPGPLPPKRVKMPPPAPPNPPPFPPPRPPSPPMDYLIKDPPVIWGSLYLSIVLLFVMAFLVYAAVHHRRLLPRVRDPEELYARLQGDWEKSSDGVDVDANDYSDVSELDEDLALGEELYHRRKAQESEEAWNQEMHEEYPLGGYAEGGGGGPTSPSSRHEHVE